MKASLTDNGSDELRLRIDTGRMLVTSLGAACSIRKTDGAYLSPTGLTSDPHLFEPRIEPGKSTTLIISLPRDQAPEPGTTLTLHIPNANFTSPFDCPSVVKEAAVRKAASVSVPSSRVIKARPKLAIAAYITAALSLLTMLGYVFNQYTELEAERSRLAASTAELEKDRALLAQGEATLASSNARLQSDFTKLAASQKYLLGEEERLRKERAQLDDDRKRFEASRTQAPSVFDNPVSQPAAPAADTPASIASVNVIRECDRLASNPSDNTKPSDQPGVAYRDIIIDEAVPACQKAIAAAPDLPRVRYQLGRALQRRNLTEALSHHAAAARMGHAAAYDNLGRAEVDVYQNFQKGADYFREGAQLGDIDSMVSLGGVIIDKGIQELFPNERYHWLMTARDRGSRPADQILKMYPPPQTSQSTDWSAPDVINRLLRYRR